jgi:hypothetical protein
METKMQLFREKGWKFATFLPIAAGQFYLLSIWLTAEYLGISQQLSNTL